MSFLELAPLPSAVPCARLHATQILREWGLQELAGDAELVISELMTNAITASAALPGRPPVLLQLIAVSGLYAWKSTTAARWSPLPSTLAQMPSTAVA